MGITTAAVDSLCTEHREEFVDLTEEIGKGGIAALLKTNN